MRIKNKILVLGIGQSNFLNQLYGEILKEDNNFEIDIDGYSNLSKITESNTSSIYSKHFNFNKTKVSKFKLYLIFINFFFTSFSFKIVFFELSQQTKLKKIKDLLIQFALAKETVKKHILPQNYDILHFHFCTPKNLIYLNFLPKNQKTICSFWGSDLLRITSASNVFYVEKALRKATKVTIQTKDLAEMLYCKYGRFLYDKTETLLFTLNREIFDAIDLLKDDSDAIAKFKQNLNIPLDKIIISVGHNAFSENNHIAILNQLKKLSEIDKNKIAVIFPLGYGRNERYISELEMLVDEIKDFKIIKLHEFFNPRQTALLRLITDLMIQMPISDALSGAMTEVLYAGNKVIVGSWLPYGILSRNGLPLEVIENFNELPKKVSEILENDLSLKSYQNASIIKSFMFPEATTPKWIELFNNLKNE